MPVVADMGLQIWDLLSCAVNGVYVGLLSISIEVIVVGMGLLSYLSSIANGAD